MLPNNTLSTSPVRGAWLYDMGVETTPTLDYKAGGIALQNPSKGLGYQIWRGRLLNAGTELSKIVLDARFAPEHLLLEYPSMYEFNFSFDFSMRPMCVFLAKEYVDEVLTDNCYLYWFDNTQGKHVLLFLGSSIETPKLLIDDPREKESDYYNRSDTCLIYLENNILYVRYLRDRFTIRYELKRNVPAISRIGMNYNLRLQFNFVRTTTCQSRKSNV